MDSLPLFPLGIVLYPGERLPLHVHEDRYKDLLRDCLEQEAPFGVILFQEGKMEDIGCTARIREIVQRYDDGRADIVVEGEERFRITNVSRKQAYMSADIEILVDQREPLPSDQTERLIAQHIKLLEIAGRTPSPSQYEDRKPLSYFVAHNAGLTLDQKQRVLEMRREAERIDFLVRHLESFIPAVEEAESIRRKVRTNGHFKDFPPEE